MKNFTRFIARQMLTAILLFFFATANAGSALPPNPPATVSSLLSLASLGNNTLVDGAMAVYDATYNNGVDYDDALKLTNTSENVSYKRDGHLLAIERRCCITCDDTLFLNVTGYRIHQYQWDININNMDAPNRTGFLIDNYLGTTTPLNLSGNNAVMFIVDNTPGSYAANRFMIIIKQPAVLPVTFTTISASRTGKSVMVKWNTENEINMQEFTVQRSIDGINFTGIGTQLPQAANGGAASYNFVDAHATAGNNYYRVKGTDLNGRAQFTAVVKVTGSSDPKLSIYPNPVTGGNINLHLENAATGNYRVNIVNKLGQPVHTETMQASADHFVRMISLGTKAAPGVYILMVSNDSGMKMELPFVIQ